MSALASFNHASTHAPDASHAHDVHSMLQVYNAQTLNSEQLAYIAHVMQELHISVDDLPSPPAALLFQGQSSAPAYAPPVVSATSMDWAASIFGQPSASDAGIAPAAAASINAVHSADTSTLPYTLPAADASPAVSDALADIVSSAGVEVNPVLLKLMVVILSCNSQESVTDNPAHSADAAQGAVEAEDDPASLFGGDADGGETGVGELCSDRVAISSFDDPSTLSDVAQWTTQDAPATQIESDPQLLPVPEAEHLQPMTFLPEPEQPQPAALLSDMEPPFAFDVGSSQEVSGVSAAEIYEMLAAIGSSPGTMVTGPLADQFGTASGHMEFPAVPAPVGNVQFPAYDVEFAPPSTVSPVQTQDQLHYGQLQDQLPHNGVQDQLQYGQMPSSQGMPPVARTGQGLRHGDVMPTTTAPLDQPYSNLSGRFSNAVMMSSQGPYASAWAQPQGHLHPQGFPFGGGLSQNLPPSYEAPWVVHARSKWQHTPDNNFAQFRANETSSAGCAQGTGVGDCERNCAPQGQPFVQGHGLAFQSGGPLPGMSMQTDPDASSIVPDGYRQDGWKQCLPRASSRSAGPCGSQSPDISGSPAYSYSPASYPSATPSLSSNSTPSPLLPPIAVQDVHRGYKRKDGPSQGDDLSHEQKRQRQDNPVQKAPYVNKPPVLPATAPPQDCSQPLSEDDRVARTEPKVAECLRVHIPSEEIECRWTMPQLNATGLVRGADGLPVPTMCGKPVPRAAMFQHIMAAHGVVPSGTADGFCLWSDDGTNGHGFCGKNNRIRSLRTHIEDTHVHLTTVFCTWCGKQFSRATSGQAGAKNDRHVHPSHCHGVGPWTAPLPTKPRKRAVQDKKKVVLKAPEFFWNHAGLCERFLRARAADAEASPGR